MGEEGDNGLGENSDLGWGIVEFCVVPFSNLTKRKLQTEAASRNLFCSFACLLTGD